MFGWWLVKRLKIIAWNGNALLKRENSRYTSLRHNCHHSKNLLLLYLPSFYHPFSYSKKKPKNFEISTLIPIRSEGRSWQRDMESTAEPMDAQSVGYRTSPTPLKVTVNEQICVSGLNGVANTFKVAIDNQQGKWIYYYDYITTLFGSHELFILRGILDFWRPLWSTVFFVEGRLSKISRLGVFWLKIAEIEHLNHFWNEFLISKAI